jgi:hypothetical protein
LKWDLLFPVSTRQHQLVKRSLKLHFNLILNFTEGKLFPMSSNLYASWMHFAIPEH